MSKKLNLMVIAGEISGDMRAAEIMKVISKQIPDVVFFGIGGNQMRAAGAKIFYDIKDMAVMGFTEVLRKYTFFRRVFNEMLDIAKKRKPAAVILVDYPGFNVRFAARTHALGIKTIYYICPQVWAWNRARIPKLAKIVDCLITIFPFEQKLFDGTGLKVDFVGHPLVDKAQKIWQDIPSALPWKGDPRIALLPGSRIHEIEHILPAMWSSAELVEKKYPEASFILAMPSHEIEDFARQKIECLSNGPSNWSFVTGNTHQVLRQAQAALVASGTATLEASLMLCPMVIIYKMSLLTYLLGRMFVRVSHIGMVNIVAGEQICPEFIQGQAVPEAIAEAINPLLKDSKKRSLMIDQLKAVNKTLGNGDAAENAADIIMRLSCEF